MSATQSLPELIATAQEKANDAAGDALALEAIAVDTFGAFEARMQHHFRRGPFSRKLKSALIEAGEANLAEWVYQYYLAVNVIKHGKGASHRELLAMSDPKFPTRKAPEDYVAGDGQPALVDVTVPGFFDGMAEAVLAAQAFLES